MEETNEALDNLQEIVDTQELREKQLDHRFQLVVYQEKRQRELDNVKGENSVGMFGVAVNPRLIDSFFCFSPTNGRAFSEGEESGRQAG